MEWELAGISCHSCRGVLGHTVTQAVLGYSPGLEGFAATLEASDSCPPTSVYFNQSHFLGSLPTLTYSVASILLWGGNPGIWPFLECVLIVDWNILRGGAAGPSFKEQCLWIQGSGVTTALSVLGGLHFSSCFWKVEVSKIWPLNQSWVTIVE